MHFQQEFKFDVLQGLCSRSCEIAMGLVQRDYGWIGEVRATFLSACEFCEDCVEVAR